jgi:hypothetical protein
MKRNHLTATAAAITLTLAAGAAFAQAAGPDFSPMKPGNYEELRVQSAPPPGPRTRRPAMMRG